MMWGAITTLVAAAVLLQPATDETNVESAKTDVANADVTNVDVTLLNGDQFSGLLQKLDDTTVSIQIDGENRDFDLKTVLDLKLKGTSATGAEESGQIEVRLTDGSRFSCRNVTVTESEAHLVTSALGRIVVPVKQVQSIRFGKETGNLRQRWAKLLEREDKKDLLVILKGGADPVLDHLPGSVGTIGEEKIQFLLSGREVTLTRSERFYGIIFYREPVVASSSPSCYLTLHGGDSLPVKGVKFAEGQFSLTLMGGTSVNVEPENLHLLDFSRGKLAYLSSMEPRSVKYTPYFDILLYKYARDRSLEGKPIRLGGKVYKRGLALHSKTEIVYRIGGEYNRFKAVMGIDENLRNRADGDVRVDIRGDGKSLYQVNVRGTDPPRELDIDVKGVRDLEIIVDFGGYLDVGDHLDLADARVTK